MLYKTIIPESQDIGGDQPVQILKISSKGLDKTASMQKRAAAFEAQIAELKPMPKKAYLHVITTGSMQHYGINRNADGYNQSSYIYKPSMPKNASCQEIPLKGGLKQYHTTYLQDAGVYQQHKTDQEKSGVVKAAAYNQKMHRGQLLIEVDTDKWSDRLHKKANGQDIFLSVGASLPRDICSLCGHQAHTFDQHCQHIKKTAGLIVSDGTKIGMINDAPKFYDISGVNVPADQMAYVLRKVASGQPAKNAIYAAKFLASRNPMGLSKVARLLSKLSKMQKQLCCKMQDDPMFQDQPEAVQKFLNAVENYDTDQVIDQCNRKAILLSPQMLFRLIGKDSQQKDLFDTYAKNCPVCGQHLMQDMQEDEDFKPFLSDGSFDSSLPVDLSLSSLLQKFIPEFGISRPALNGKVIHITIKSFGKPEKSLKPLKDKLSETKQEDKDKSQQEETKDMQKQAALIDNEFRRTYARYFLSFASKNSQDTCNLAMQKLARYK